LDVLGNTAIGVQISSDVEGRLAPELETVVYRITREALINVRKHSQAKQVMVRLKRAGKRLALTIADDGVGFDGATLRDRATHHLGLTRIHELAGSLGGGSRVTSGIGAGTTVDVGLPLLES
jgi:signal transduction histidine kinase